ncbi:glycosyltransferase [Chloroflexota bacterium]
MNVLFIHEVDWLNKVVFDIHSLAEVLSIRGHHVYAIDYENNWRKNSLLDIGSLKTKVFADVSRALAGSSVCVRRPGFIKIPGLSRLSAAFTNYLEIRKVIKKEQIDAILLYSVPTTGLQTIVIAKGCGIPVLFRSIDVLNQLTPVRLLRPITRFLEKMVYSRVNGILCLTPGLSKYVTSLGADENKVGLLLMPVDTDIFYNFPPSEKVFQKWGLTHQDKVILFMGTLFDFCGLDDFIPLFQRVIEENPMAKLLIVGDGPQRLKLEKLVSELNLREKVIITGFEPYEMMPHYINLASVCINPFRINDATRDIFPGKTVQFLACGKPLVASGLPGMKAVVTGESQGVIYTDNSDEMVGEVVSLLNSPEKCERIGKAGFNYVAKVHSYDVIAGQLEEKIHEAVNNLH